MKKQEHQAVTGEGNASRDWCIEIERNGEKQYIGKCIATRKEIETALPFSSIYGNLVTIPASAEGSSGEIPDAERIANLQSNLRNEVNAHVKVIRQRDALLERLRDISDIANDPTLVKSIDGNMCSNGYKVLDRIYEISAAAIAKV